MVPLRTRLKNGDIVEIVTNPSHKPSRDWLNFVATSRARNKIKHLIQEEEKQRAIDLGRKLLEKEARRFQVNLEKLLDGDGFAKAAADLAVQKVDDLFAQLGYGKLSPKFVLDKLVPNLEYTRFMMQGANLLHITATVLMMGFALGHIYLGTIGMQGAYKSMREGYVDDAWAREHHDIWYQEVVDGKVPRIRAPEHDGDHAPSAAPKTI